MSENHSEKLHISNLPEGQRKILDLCGEINLWYLRIRENDVPSASDQNILDLLDETQNLYEKTDPIVNFDTNDSVHVKLGVMRGKLEKKYWKVKEWLSEKEGWHNEETSFTQDTLKPSQMAKEAVKSLKKRGRRKIAFTGTCIPAKESKDAYGDFVRIEARKNIEGNLSVGYYEVFDFTSFKRSHISSLRNKAGEIDLQPLRSLFGKQVDNHVRRSKRSNYFAEEITLDNIRFTARQHDYGGTELSLAVNCSNTDEAGKTIELLLQLVKDSPKTNR